MYPEKMIYDNQNLNNFINFNNYSITKKSHLQNLYVVTFNPFKYNSMSKLKIQSIIINNSIYKINKLMK